MWILKSAPGNYDRQLRLGVTGLAQGPNLSKKLFFRETFPAYKPPFPNPILLHHLIACSSPLYKTPHNTHFLQKDVPAIPTQSRAHFLCFPSSKQHWTGVVRALISCWFSLPAGWPWASHNLQPPFQNHNNEDSVMPLRVILRIQMRLCI